MLFLYTRAYQPLTNFKTNWVENFKENDWKMLLYISSLRHNIILAIQLKWKRDGNYPNLLTV